MKERFVYVPDNLNIFQGFYESFLFNSDSECNFNKNEKQYHPNPEHYVDQEIDDFDEFTKDVCKGIASEIEDLLVDGEIFTECEYESMSSPREYNYSTDKIHLDVEVDFELLKGELIGNAELRNGFNEYLNDKYTSRSGFVSFVANNVYDYFENDEYYDVMIDYWLLTKIYDDSDVVKGQCDWTQYTERCVEIADECLYNHMTPISVSDWIRSFMDMNNEKIVDFVRKYSNNGYADWSSACELSQIINDDERMKSEFMEAAGLDWWYDQGIKEYRGEE